MLRKSLFAIVTMLLLVGAMQFQASGQPKPPNKKQLAKATKLAKEGDEAFNKKNYRQAINKYFEAIGIVPFYPGAYYNKGYAHYNLKELDQSIKDLSTALTQGYKAIDVYKLRGYIYYEQKDFSAVLSDTEQPNNAYLYLLAGDAHRGLENFRAALNAYKKASEIDAQNPNTYYFIALCHNELREYAQQGEYARKAIQMASPFKGESYDLLGQSLLAQKKYADAADAYEQALVSKPNLINAYTNLGNLYRILNRYDDAISAVERGLKLYPNDGNLWVSLGWYRSLANKHQDSITASAQAVKLLPNEHMGWTNMCRAYYDLQQFESAVTACGNALKLSPDDGETHLYIARAYEKLNKKNLATPSYAKAVTGLSKFTRDNPDEPDGFYLLGNAYYSVDQYPKAVAAYQRSLELNPNFVQVRFNLGVVFVIQGDKTAASRQYNTLLKLDSDFAAKLNDLIKKMK
jgi:tetratricopeptide (TPR) repeat protein